MIRAVSSDFESQNIFFEFWNEDAERGLPVIFAKSSLFTVRNKRVPRKEHKEKLLYSSSQDVKLIYTGQELRADSDELVWLQILNYARRTRHGVLAEFTPYQLCRDIGWGTSVIYYQIVKYSLLRLSANVLDVRSKKLNKLRWLSLIEDVTVPEHQDGNAHQRWYVYINPEIVQLFSGQQYIRVHWNKYRKLRPITRRLFDYFACHSTPHPLRLDTLHQMCDSDCSKLRKWKQQVAKSCDELINKGMLSEAWIADGKVHCHR